MKRTAEIAFSLFVIVFLVTLTGYGQDSSDNRVKYTPEFRFKDGIYLNFDQVKENDPIPKAKILTSADFNDKDFFKKVFSAEKIYFYDELGVRQEVEKNNIWGFSRNGVIYVIVQGNYNRITFVGNICHFVADVTTYETNNYNYYSPYGYYDPYYYSPYSYYGGYNPYGYYSPYGSTHSTPRNEIKQYIIDFETGKVMDFTVDNVELLIMKDPDLYEEFLKLPKAKKKELMFVYVRKFNDKNPLYLPVK
jgi:hypothetical protein